MSTDTQTFSKHDIRRSFERAAETYDDAAVLQLEVGMRMLERLDIVRMQPDVILEVGCGTGRCTCKLFDRYRKAKVIALDLASSMLQLTRKRSPWLRKKAFICGDAEALPLQDNSCDLLFSNLTVQWCSDLEVTFQEFKRVLRPGGLLMFSTLGPDTLIELKKSWAAVDGQAHVNEFIDMHDVGDAVLQAGFADPVIDMEKITMTYEDVHTLMRDLKGIGAHNVLQDRSRSMTGPGKIRAMVKAYEVFRSEGRLPATYEVVYGHAWKADTTKSVDVKLT